MRRLVSRIATGRRILGLLALAAIAAAGGIVLPAPASRIFYLAATIAATLSAAGFLFSWKRDVALLRSAMRDAERNQAFLKDSLASINGVLELNRAVQDSSAFERSEPEKSEASESRNPSSIYSPTVITASAVLAKPNAHVAGRGAAEQTMAPDSLAKLDSILRAQGTQKVRRVMWIGPFDERMSEEPNWTVSTIGHGLEFGRPDPTATYLVVNFRSCAFTKWSYFQSSLNFERFQGLQEFIKETRGNGTIVILVRSLVPDHFSQSLENVVDVICDEHFEPIGQSDFDSMPVFNFIERVVGGSR